MFFCVYISQTEKKKILYAHPVHLVFPIFISVFVDKNWERTQSNGGRGWLKY